MYKIKTNKNKLTRNCTLLFQFLGLNKRELQTENEFVVLMSDHHNRNCNAQLKLNNNIFNIIIQLYS